jgi:hypothetical protein
LRDPAEVELTKLEDHPRYRAVAAELAALEARLRESERREQVAKARARGQQPIGSIQDRAKQLLAGGQIIAATPQTEFAAAAEEQDILRRAIVAKHEERAAVVATLSHEACSKFVPLNADYLRRTLEAVTELYASLDGARVIRARLVAAGYQLSDTALPVHQFPQAALLGNPDLMVSGTNPAAEFKRWLKARGIV